MTDVYGDEYQKWRQTRIAIRADPDLCKRAITRFSEVCSRQQIKWKYQPPLPSSVTNGLNTVNNPAAIFKAMAKLGFNNTYETMSSREIDFFFSRILQYMDVIKSLAVVRLPLAGLVPDDRPENYTYERLARDARKFLLSLVSDYYRHRHQ